MMSAAYRHISLRLCHILSAVYRQMALWLCHMLSAYTGTWHSYCVTCLLQYTGTLHSDRVTCCLQYTGTWHSDHVTCCLQYTGTRHSDRVTYCLQYTGSLMYTECYGKVSCCEIYLTTFNHRPPSTEYQQHAMAQVVGCQHCRGLGSIPSQSMWNLWWTKSHRDRPVSQYFSPPLPTSLYQCYTLIHSNIQPSMTATT